MRLRRGADGSRQAAVHWTPLLQPAILGIVVGAILERVSRKSLRTYLVHPFVPLPLASGAYLV